MAGIGDEHPGKEASGDLVPRHPVHWSNREGAGILKTLAPSLFDHLIPYVRRWEAQPGKRKTMTLEIKKTSRNLGASVWRTVFRYGDARSFFQKERNHEQTHPERVAPG